MKRVAVIDHGLSNIGSVVNMLKRIGVEAVKADEPADLNSCERIILPGVGAWDAAMGRIQESGFLDALVREVLEKKKPFLGVCLGMQLLFEGSNEGQQAGFGWIPGQLRKFGGGGEANLKVPHMGWNGVELARPHPLVDSLPEKSKFYFVHSYYAEDAGDCTLMWSHYGRRFVAAVARDNIMGVQFHPEKSHKYGFQLFRSFMDIPL